MKKLLIVLMIIAGFTNAEAQSMLRVHLTDNTPVNVSLDGRYFNKRGTGVTVGDLPPGRHRLQIYAANQDRRGRMFQDIVYEGKVKTIDGMITLFTYDPASGSIDIQQQEIGAYQANSQQGSNQGQQGGGNDNGNYGNNNYGNNNSNYGNNNGNYGNDNGGSMQSSPASPAKMGTLTDSKIDALKTTVAAKKTDTEKMKALKDGLQGEQITTGQVSDMMDWFGFESSKVDFAEWAYSSTVDKEYFSDLESKLTYKDYQDALDKFIKSK